MAFIIKIPIFMKRFFLPFLLILLLAPQIQAQKKNYIFSIEPFTGYTDGSIQEILYHSGSLKDKKASLLEWDKKYLTLGFVLDAKYKKIGFEAFFSSSIHSGFGQMTDSDWMNTSDPEMKTTYSIGDTTAKNNYRTGLNFNCILYQYSIFSFTLQTGLEYSYDKFYRGSDAKGFYGNLIGIRDEQGRLIDVRERSVPVAWNDSDAVKVPYDRWDQTSGTWKHGHLLGIKYSQHQFYSWAGLGAKVRPLLPVEITVCALISPFSYFSATDRHNGKNFTSHMIQDSWWSAWKCTAAFQWNFKQNMALSIKADFSGTLTIRGDNYNDWYKDKYQDSGTKVKAKNFSAGIKFII